MCTSFLVLITYVATPNLLRLFLLGLTRCYDWIRLFEWFLLGYNWGLCNWSCCEHRFDDLVAKLRATVIRYIIVSYR